MPPGAAEIFAPSSPVQPPQACTALWHKRRRGDTAECLRCRFAPMAARSARAHQVTNARPRPSAWALNSRLWQLAALVLIERIAHVRGGCTPGNSRRSASAVNSRLWQLATARAHREDSTRSRRGMVLNSLRLVFSHLSGGVWRRPAPRPLRKISPPNEGSPRAPLFCGFCGVTCGD